MNDPSTPGTLFVVATPIGNLEDLTYRAIRILGEVDLIACEDTRHTRKLLNHFQIQTKVTSYYREKELYKSEILIKKLQEGLNIALVSDAGTPGISDPGAVLTQLVASADIAVIPVPGPSALTAALSVAGIRESQFYFAGFPPAKKGQRRKFFKTLTSLYVPVIFYESPHRIRQCLRDCLDIFGDRQAVVFRELTKIHEQSYRGSISSIIESLQQKIKGEFVVILHGQEKPKEEQPEDLGNLLLWYKEQADITLKDAVSRVASDLDLSRSEVYRKALDIWKK